MLSMEQIELVKEYAMGAVLSDSNEIGYTAFAEALEQDTIPEEVIVYKPYEHLDAQELLEAMEEHYSVFETFAEQLMEIENGGVKNPATPEPIPARDVLNNIYRDEQLRWEGK